MHLVYSGNPMQMTLDESSYTTIHDYLMKYIVFNEALLDRIHIIHVANKKSYNEVVNGRVLYPSVARSLIEIVQQNINKQTRYEICDNLSGRRQEQAVDLQLILQGLDIALFDDQHTKEQVCEGLEQYMRFTNILQVGEKAGIEQFMR